MTFIAKKFKPPRKKGGSKGIRNGMWKGDEVKYAGLHTWVNRNMINMGVCNCCKQKKKVEAANISGEYKREITDWEWLCRKCHMEKDGRINNLLMGKIKRSEINQEK